MFCSFGQLYQTCLARMCSTLAQRKYSFILCRFKPESKRGVIRAKRLPNTFWVNLRVLNVHVLSLGEMTFISEYKANFKACNSNFYTAVKFPSVRTIANVPSDNSPWRCQVDAQSDLLWTLMTGANRAIPAHTHTVGWLVLDFSRHGWLTRRFSTRQLSAGRNLEIEP